MKLSDYFRGITYASVGPRDIILLWADIIENGGMQALIQYPVMRFL
jgi:hypothetical protein